MAISKFNDDVVVHSKLGDNPIIDDGLTPDELKALFDKPAETIKNWINDTLIPFVDSLAPDTALSAYFQSLKPSAYPCIWFQVTGGVTQNLVFIDRDGVEHTIFPKSVVTDYADGSIKTAALSTGCVTTDKIAANSIATENLMKAAVTGDKIAGKSVDFSKLADDAIKLTYTNIAVSNWVSGSGMEGFPYVGVCSLPNVTASMVPEIIFGTEDATSGKFAPTADTFNGGVHIYASESVDSVVLPTVILWR